MRNWSFNKKILTIGLIFVITVAGISATGFVGLSKLEKTLDTTTILYDIESSFSALSEGHDKVRALEANAILEPTVEQTSLFPKRMTDVYRDWEAGLNALSLKVSDNNQKTKINELKSTISKRRELSDKILKAALEGENEQAFELHNTEEGPAKPLDERIQKLTGEIIQAERVAASVMRREVSLVSKTWMYWMGVVSALGLGFGLLLSQAVVAGLNRSLSRTTENLSEASNQFFTRSQQISESSASLALATSSEATSIRETASTLKDIGALSEIGSVNSKKAAEVATEAVVHAGRGRDYVENVVAAIDDINQYDQSVMSQIGESHKQLADVVNVIADIKGKAKFINDVAYQTKLLSFNASVEAARAGEFGKGFAVVAEELGNLSTLSTATAKDIATLLEESLRKADGLVRETQLKIESLAAVKRDKIDRGSAAVAQCGPILNELCEKTKQLENRTNEIATNCEMQASGLSEVNKAMVLLEQVTIQNANNASVCATATLELTTQAEGVKTSTRNLVNSIRGQNAQTMRTRMSAQEAIPEVQSEESDAGRNEEKTRLRAVPQRHESRTTRNRHQRRHSSENRMRKAAGAEDIQFDDDPRLHDT